MARPTGDPTVRRDCSAWYPESAAQRANATGAPIWEPDFSGRGQDGRYDLGSISVE
jgi:hypothetical protein